MFKYTIILALCLVSIQANSELERMMEEMRRSLSMGSMPSQRSMNMMQQQQPMMRTQQVSSGYGQQQQPQRMTPPPQQPPKQESNYGSAPAPVPQRMVAPQPPRMAPPKQESSYGSAPAPVPQRMAPPKQESSYGSAATVQKMVSPCDVMPCKNMGICREQGNSFTCECSIFFTGPTCEETAPNFGRGFEHMINGRLVEKTLSACAPNPCQNEGICTEQGSSFTCQCPWGFSGPRCEVFTTDCSSNPCPSNKICKASYGGGHECVCPPNRAGANCEQINDACSSSPCEYGGICSAVEGGDFTCDCPKSVDGLTGSTGKRCNERWTNPCTLEVIESVEMKQFVCPWDAKAYLVCTDINVFNTMKCAPGSRFNKQWSHCVPDSYNPPVCPSDHCMNDGQCIIDETNELRCVCKKGFQGDFCEEEINECRTGGDQACQGGQCIDQVGGFFCQCSNGIGEDCRNTIPLPCTPSNLARGLFYHALPSVKGDSYVQCLDEQTWTVRRCQDGLFWNEELQTCSHVKAEKLSGQCAMRPCQNDGHCIETASSYECECKKGYEGAHCETMIDYCASNPCQNGGKCLGYAGGYSCVCPDKMVDDCCCSGIVNPCPPKSQLIPGVNNYAPHLAPNRYIHCAANGHAFVRTCSHGSIWKQDMMSCLSLDTVKGIEMQREYELKAEAEDKLNMVGRFAPKEPTMTSPTSGYAAPAPQRMAPPTPSSSSGYAAPAPQRMAPRQPTYAAPAPVPAPAPAPRQPSFVAPPKMQPQQPSYESYAAPAPAPRQPSFVAPPKMQPQQPTYESYAPQMLSYRSYYTPSY